MRGSVCVGVQCDPDMVVTVSLSDVCASGMSRCREHPPNQVHWLTLPLHQPLKVRGMEGEEGGRGDSRQWCCLILR